MEIGHIDNQIIVKQTQLRVLTDPVKRQEVNKQLKVLLLKKEIETIRKKIEQLSG